MLLANSSAVLKAYMTVSFYQEEMKGLSTASEFRDDLWLKKEPVA